MGRGPTMKHGSVTVDPKAREFDRLFKTLGSMPHVLCWNCRKLTPFEVERCEHCGSPFAGSTGGAYRSGRIPADVPARSTRTNAGPRARSLSEIVEDLRRIREMSDGYRHSRRGESYRYLYQCPSCNRFVTEQATSCVCGVRFEAPSPETFHCPECAASIPSGRNSCPVCLSSFGGPSSYRDDFVYACPRCGSRVSADAFRCSCGARFED